MENLPEHVAIVPDGNRRWAQQHGLPALEGHRRGADRIHQVVDELIRRGAKYLTLWGFSIDNWKRTTKEVQSIFQLLQLWIEKDTPWLHESGVRLRHIGRFYDLPDSLQQAIYRALHLTHNNTGMNLVLAFNYSGRAEIVDAVNRILNARIFSEVDENSFPSFLYTDSIPDVNLVIRTAGDFRISNFMLWQTAYSEFYFTDVLWPDFDEKELGKALQDYSERQRRFGGD